MIEQIENPIEQFVAFIDERESIRQRRESGKPWPWTAEPILQNYRFTNINRENDAVSKHYQKTVRNRYSDHYLVLPGTVLYRWFNRPSTCDSFFNEPFLMNNHSFFEDYIYTGESRMLYEALQRVPPPHVTGAYLIPSKPGYPKGEGVIEYFVDWTTKPWHDQWGQWINHTPTLQEIYDWINSQGLGSFMRAQIIADLKYLPFLKNAEDWWTFAAPGPGSMKGLNIVLGQNMDSPWTINGWRESLNELSAIVMPMLEEVGIEKIHNQDLQNCLCEFSKFTKVARGLGRPRQVFKHRG